jgi:hypothetical protein
MLTFKRGRRTVRISPRDLNKLRDLGFAREHNGEWTVDPDGFALITRDAKPAKRKTKRKVKHLKDTPAGREKLVKMRDPSKLSNEDLQHYFRWMEMDVFARGKGYKAETPHRDPKALADRALLEMGNRLVAATDKPVGGLSRADLVNGYRRHVVG